jgi:hypothetical protein
MNDFPTHRIDVLEIERRAHQMRAEATREAAVAIRAWLKARFAATGHLFGRHA